MKRDFKIRLIITLPFGRYVFVRDNGNIRFSERDIRRKIRVDLGKS